MAVRAHSSAPGGIDARVSAVLAAAVIWDNHACIPPRPWTRAFCRISNCPRAGVTAVTLNVGFGDNTLGDHVRMLAQFRHWVAARPDQYRIVRTVDDVTAAKKRRQLAVCFDIEGMNAIEAQLRLIQLYYGLGVRWMLIAYNRTNRAGACQELESETRHPVQVKWGIKIPMRDGIRLNATLYLPKNRQGPRPTIFTFTPYIADAYHDVGISLAEHGYPYLAVDVRGRGNSEGEFAPFFNEPKDGHDIVEWLARQPYCNGKIGTCGISYVGFDQWAIVRELPPHLATIVPSAPAFIGLDYPIRHNVFFSFLARWLIATWGNTQQTATFADEKYWSSEYLRFMESGLPYRELVRFFGFSSEPFQEWLDHPHQDEYWDRANPTPEQFAQASLPVLSLTGIYDGDQPGTMEFYRQHLRYAARRCSSVAACVSTSSWPAIARTPTFSSACRMCIPTAARSSSAGRVSSGFPIATGCRPSHSCRMR